jgi:hypothetical protein
MMVTRVDTNAVHNANPVQVSLAVSVFLVRVGLALSMETDEPYQSVELAKLHFEI